MQVHATVENGQTREIVFTLGVGADEDQARQLVYRFRGISNAHRALEGVWHYWSRTLGAAYFETPDPAVNFIKRLVGLPGDHVRIRSNQLIINGVPVPLQLDGRYDDGCYHNMREATEILGNHRHQTLACLTPHEIAAEPSASCSRVLDHNYECVEPSVPGWRDHSDKDEMVVPAGHYLMIGDNRDNSWDGRYWGFVPEDHLVGKATRIWFNWDLHRSGGPVWSRIGHRIE